MRVNVPILVANVKSGPLRGRLDRVFWSEVSPCNVMSITMSKSKGEKREKPEVQRWSYKRWVFCLGSQGLTVVLGCKRKVVFFFLFLVRLLPQGGEDGEPTHFGIHHAIQTVGESGEQSRILLFYLEGVEHSENMGEIQHDSTSHANFQTIKGTVCPKT